MRAVAAQSLAAPVAIRASQVDFPDHAFADQLAVIRLHDFRDELVSRGARESIVSALEFDVGIADAAE